MNKAIVALTLGAGMLVSLAGNDRTANAAERTVTLEVPMWCPSCPFIVKRSLEKVAGVLDVTVSFEAQTATVRYDDEQSTVAALTRATSDVGFPSKVAESE